MFRSYLRDKPSLQSKISGEKTRRKRELKKREKYNVYTILLRRVKENGRRFRKQTSQ